jgi:hypothetical protein
MQTLDSNDDCFGHGLTRRDLLRAGVASAGVIGLSLADQARLRADSGKSDAANCILLFLVGGPSHLDTWDLKPNAPDNVRGPFRPIQTSVPGVHICEHFPRMARLADKYAIVRSVHHHEAPIHEAGHQLMQTGRLLRAGPEQPHVGAVVSRLRGRRSTGAPSFVVLPGLIGDTGVNISHGQSAGQIGPEHEPRVLPLGSEHDDMLDRYGRTTFGRSCLMARRLVEGGVRFVTVNMFDTLFNKVTWDCHADGGALSTTLNDYRDTLCPMFDMAYAALLSDLHERGMLASTLVVAMGEFGRTPRVNANGGRDHWPGVWSILFAGGHVRGGQVIGASDRLGGEPSDRPVSPAEVAATIYKGIGIDPETQLAGLASGSTPVLLADGSPVEELFR